METMHPVVLRGRTAGPALPREEHSERLEALRAAAADAGLAAVVVYGDARDYAALCYVSGYIPALRWAVALVPVAGEPSLYLAGPTRDLAYTQTLTWIDDIHAVSELDDALARLRRKGHVALVGAERIRASVRRRLAAAADLVEGDERLLEERMWTPRPRELAPLRAAAALTRHAADVAEKEHAGGAGATEALLAAERAAREQGAHDVRALYSLDGGRTVRPFETVVEGRPRTLAFYLAVELDGYWGEAMRTSGAEPALAKAVAERLRDVAAELEPGLAAREVIDRLGRLPEGTERHPVVSGRRAIARLGLGRDDRFAADADAELAPGAYSLRAGALAGETAVLLSTSVEVGLDGRAA